MFPIRVVVSAVPGAECVRCADPPSPVGSSTVIDSYAVVNGSTPVHQLVDSVLAALGLHQLSYGAKGMVEINNWKPLPFENIVDSQDCTAETLLKDVSNHATLRIVTKQMDNATVECAREMRERLLTAVMQRCNHLLHSIKNEQLREFVETLVSSDTTVSSISADHVQGFNQWLDDLHNAPLAPPTPTPTTPTSNNTTGIGLNELVAPGGAFQNGAAGRFNPLLELPKLIRWFNDNATPSRQKLMHYAHVLNQSAHRRHNRVSYQQLSNWFACARRLRQMQQSQQQQSRHDNSSGDKSDPIHNSDSASRNSEAASADGSLVAKDLTVAKRETSTYPPHLDTSGSPPHHAFNLNDLLKTKEAEQRRKQQQQLAGGGDAPMDCGDAIQPQVDGAHGAGEMEEKHSDPTLSHALSTSNMAGTGSGYPMLPFLQQIAMLQAAAAAAAAQQQANAAPGAPLAPHNPNDPLAAIVAGQGGSDSGRESQDPAASNSSPHGCTAEQQQQHAAAAAAAGIDLSAAHAVAAIGSMLAAQSSHVNANGDVNAPAGFRPGASTSSSKHRSSTPQPSNQHRGPTPGGTPGTQGNGQATPTSGAAAGNNAGSRSRLMFDPLTELPLLEKWFEDNPHPSWIQIDCYTETLNGQPYRMQYPPISTHNVKIWFKNRRAKCKRMQETAAQAVKNASLAQNLAMIDKFKPFMQHGSAAAASDAVDTGDKLQQVDAAGVKTEALHSADQLAVSAADA